MKLLIATTNPGKLREIQELLAQPGLELVTLDDWPGIEAPEEVGASFAENARIKALYYAARTGCTTVAEDSGLHIDALGGAPGVQSSRFGGTHCSYPDKFQLLYEALAAVGSSSSPARFLCDVALARPGRIVFETHGSIEGRIAESPKGTGGFGYDPIFYYPPFGCTLAEAGELKVSVSHRAQAFRQLSAFLEDSHDKIDQMTR